MTIEIIRRGTRPDDLKYVTTCDHCGTEFSFHKRDAKFVSDQRDGDYFTIPCPVCHKIDTIGSLVPLPPRPTR